MIMPLFVFAKICHAIMRRQIGGNMRLGDQLFYSKHFGSVEMVNDEECIKMTRTIKSTNIGVIDEVRRRLREYDDMFNFGSHTGTLYNVEDHEVYFSVYIPVEKFENDLEFVYNVVVGILENMNNYIEEYAI